MANEDQIAEWNGALGRRWAEAQSDIDRLVGPFGAAALDAAAPRSGERVIDIGCGAGDTSLALAEAVGPSGAVLGVDVSAPMLEVARRRGAGLAHLDFAEADASSADLPAERDLLYSRFGVMFFDDPPAAFAHLRGTLRPGGRAAFCCWRAARENGWAMTPVSAARTALKVEQPPADPLAPGPFAFGDRERVRAILGAAGFADVAVEPFDAPVYLGSTARTAAEGAARMGPLSRFIRFVGEERVGEVVDAVTKALQGHETPQGVSLPGAVWIVTARAR